jgi:hypothetical protein
MEVITYQPNHLSTSRASKSIPFLHLPWSAHSVSTPLSFSGQECDEPLDENGLPEVIDLTGDSSDDVST